MTNLCNHKLQLPMFISETLDTPDKLIILHCTLNANHHINIWHHAYGQFADIPFLITWKIINNKMHFRIHVDDEPDGILND